MKRLIVALLILPLFVACNQKELKQLREQNQQLTSMAKQKDSTINDFIESLNTIEENLEIIKKKETIIAVNSENPNQSQKQKIASDLTSINNLLEQNRMKIEDLQKKLNNSYYQNSKLRKLTDRLRAELDLKANEIAALNEKVAKLNIEVDNLNGKVTELNGTVLALNTENETKTKLIEEQIEELNTAFYVCGTSRELQEKKVITKDGGFIGIGRTSVLNEDFNKNEFKKIDITKTTTIPVTGKKISLVTSHPSNSYKVEGVDKVEGITILDPAEFWKSSKFLVVAVR
jgi:DNA repair exonuclease SbcCD ATPase subunit